MTTERKIDFMALRDVGQIFNTTFRFIKQSKGLLFKCITYYIMPFGLVSGFLLFGGLAGMLSQLFGGRFADEGDLVWSVLMLFFGMLALYVTYSTYVTLVFEYMRLYYEREDPLSITHGEVWRATRKRFFHGLLNVLVWGIMVLVFSFASLLVIGLINLLGTGISMAIGSGIILGIYVIIVQIASRLIQLYVHVITFPMLFLNAFERIDIFGAFGRTFSMVNRKRNLPHAMGVAIICLVVVLVLQANVIALPTEIIWGVIEYNDLNVRDWLNPNNLWYKLFFYLFLPLLYMLYLYTICISFISQGFMILNLSERADGKGLYSRIEKMGTRNDMGPEHYDVAY